MYEFIRVSFFSLKNGVYKECAQIIRRYVIYMYSVSGIHHIQRWSLANQVFAEILTAVELVQKAKPTQLPRVAWELQIRRGTYTSESLVHNHETTFKSYICIILETWLIIAQLYSILLVFSASV